MHRYLRVFFTILLISCAVNFSAPQSVYALKPEEVLVVYNSHYTESIYLALEYQKRRGIPDKNMFNIVSKSPHRISRSQYTTEIKEKIETYLTEEGLKDKILCVLLVYRVPLIITDSDKKEALKKHKETLASLNETLIQTRDEEKVPSLTSKIKETETIIANIKRSRPEASVDSELTLLFLDHKINMWVPNPYYLGRGTKLRPFSRSFPIYMVSRLDAPKPSTVSRIMRESIEAEQNGLSGTAYIDTRGFSDKDPKNSYATMDAILRQTAKLLEKYGMETVVENTGALFGEGACPNTAVYWGWYALQNFRDSFTFEPGAIAVHIASIECQTLTSTGSIWCPNLLEKGACVTVGPVDEPYLHAFPHPVIFFNALFAGLSLAEAYFSALPVLSWQMVLVGDPLYRPFKHRLPSEQDRRHNNRQPSPAENTSHSDSNKWKSVPFQ